MSDGAQILVQLGPQSVDERLRRALDLQRWLHATGVIERMLVDEHIEVWMPGTLWRSAVDGSADYPFDFEVKDNTVEISAEIEVYSALGNAEDATCARCGTPFHAGDRLAGLLEQWVGDSEPAVTCAQCGWTALLGDWPTDNPVAVAGAPAVVFINWPPLRDTFVASVTERLGGGRCRLVRQRL